MRNVHLARAAIAAIRANPERHDQSDWRCGTTMCFAGFVAEAAGARWAFLEEWSAMVVAGDNAEPTSLAGQYSLKLSPGVTPDTPVEPVANYVLRLLDLTAYEQNDFFYEAFTVNDLERLLDKYAPEQREV